MKRIMKRIGIGILLVALNAADFRFREYHQIENSNEKVVVNYLISGLYALFCFTLLLRFVDGRKPWWYIIDAIVLTILTMGVCDFISLKMHPSDNLSVILPLSELAGLLLLPVNLAALALATLFMWLGGKIWEGRRAGAAEAGTGD